MKTPIYTIFDKKARVYNKPFFFPNDDVALRSASNLLSGESEIALHPEDYTLYRIGTFCDDTAEIIYDENQALCNFNELVKPK